MVRGGPANDPEFLGDLAVGPTGGEEDGQSGPVASIEQNQHGRREGRWFGEAHDLASMGREEGSPQGRIPSLPTPRTRVDGGRCQRGSNPNLAARLP